MAELTDLKGLTLNKKDEAIAKLFNKNLAAWKDSVAFSKSSLNQSNRKQKRRVVVIKKDHIIANN